MDIIKLRTLEGLAARRKAAGFTQQGLADALGIQRPALAAWETGVSCPRAGILPALADLLLCSIEDLYRAPEEPSSCEEIIPDREEEDHAG